MLDTKMNPIHLLLFINILISSHAECKEVLLDFLEFPQNHPEVQLSESCVNSLREIKSGIESDQLWAMKVRDASGFSRSGFIFGNNFWLGQEVACNLLTHPIEIPLTPTKTRRMHRNDTVVASKVPVEYRMFYVNHTSPIQFDSEMFYFVGLHIGLCFPKLCDEKEIKIMAGNIFQSNEFNNTAIYGRASFFGTKVLKLRENFFQEPVTILLM